ncbi:MAG: DUF1501 domain-containing protein [Saprospiraceae bacterium]|nr:DUF1501 domain-containing protein [Saprospiraceae bacterium]MBX7177958.1 DUF1501 domain-containing protein [Saprospiraceae bacterium]MCB0591965.1 DUF1501 domain-containing protein [Saprospiraceae bacterium]MCO5284384.1 DUF1501 domain-containing protein [Saprospiraceae bacterium]MCO6471277.1 DUF1501 domain-containing protein [Saprospiraceae bacterium]
MKRRNFLRISTPAVLGPLVLEKSILKPFATGSLARIFNCEDVNDRILMIVQLKGGNDGLNCIVPTNQYDTYKNFRPTIGTSLDQLIPLDNTLSNDDHISLHPGLISFKELYDQGCFTLVQAVGYANSNKSHFKGTDLWLSGGDSTPAHFNYKSGWMGRYLDASYPGLAGEPTVDHPDPLGIQLGSKQQFLGFHTEHQHEAGINLSGQDPAGFYSLVSELGGIAPAHIPTSDYGNNIEYIIDIEHSTSRYSNRISEVFKKGINMGTYPDYDLADQLKTVARMISGGGKTKIYVVSIGSFDTHQNQVEGSNPLDGTHGKLLTQLSESILAFQNDLRMMQLDDRVVGVTFSEFGRRPKENGSKGTDHGTVAPMFLFGTPVRAGIVGKNIDLSQVGSGNDIVGMGNDYRDVFTALLQDWLGASDRVLEDTYFGDYVTTKAPILESQYVVSPECYIDTYLSSSIFNRPAQLSLYPNPARNVFSFQINPGGQGVAFITLTDTSGRTIKQWKMNYVNGENNLTFGITNVEAGIYMVQMTLSESRRRYTGKLVVID